MVFEYFFAYMQCYFKPIFSISLDYLFIDNFPIVWSYIIRCKLCSFLIFKYCFATKLSPRFEPSLMWFYRPLNFALIPLFNNLSSLGVPFIYTFIVFLRALLPQVVSLLNFLQFHQFFKVQENIQRPNRL
jgi:hypothetical protein